MYPVFCICLPCVQTGVRFGVAMQRRALIDLPVGPHTALRLKKEYRYSSTPLMGLTGRFFYLRVLRTTYLDDIVWNRYRYMYTSCTHTNQVRTGNTGDPLLRILILDNIIL